MNGEGAERQKPRWQSRMLSVGTLTMTTLFAAAMTLILWRAFLYQRVGMALGLGVSCFTFLVLSVAFYVLLMWFFFEHPEEIRRRLPYSSKQLRRRREKYFDNLPRG